MCGGKIFKPLGSVCVKLQRNFLSLFGGCVGRPTLAGNVLRLGEGGDFHHKC